LKGSKQPPGEAFLAVFGDTEDSGLVQFHDAWWVPADPGSGGAEKPFVRDVITVHHPEYYQESSPPLPSDQDSPTPVPFLAVRGAFLFAVTSPSAEWSDLLKVMVTEMLTTHGVGGKKAAGYGTFIRPKRGPDVPSTELPPQNSQRVPGKVRREGKDTYLIFLEDGSVLNPPPGTTWMKCKKKKLQRLPEGKESGSFSFLVIPREGSWTILEICEAGAPENE